MSAVPCSVPDASRQNSTVGKESRSQHILIMDDDETLRMIFTRILTDSGHAVKVTNNGQQAIDLYMETYKTTRPFNLVIIDLIVPSGMGGSETARRLREFDKNAKVIVTSGYAHDQIMDNFQEYGFVGAIRKPFNARELREIVASVA